MISFITNIPVPYRELLHERLYKELGENYCVIYASKLEPNRKWSFNLGNYNYSFLKKGLTIPLGNSFIHINFDVFSALRRNNPKVLIITGFYFTMLFAWIWAILKKRKIIVFIDGTIQSESNLTFFHRILRKVLFKKAISFIGPSEATFALYKSYGIDSEAMFKSHLFVDNKRYFPSEEKEFDFLFCGHLNKNKNPLFFLKVIEELQKRDVKISALMLGDGVDKLEVDAYVQSNNLNVLVKGFVGQSELPFYFSKCRVLLFPTENDAWGVVANEACASGLPVITTPMAGCSNDLVVDGLNGFVLPLNLELWVEKSFLLLSNSSIYNNFSKNSLNIVHAYNVENSVQGVLDAVNYALKNENSNNS